MELNFHEKKYNAGTSLLSAMAVDDLVACGNSILPTVDFQ